MTDRTIVLLPGLLCDDVAWAAQQRDLASRGRCIVPDYGVLASITAMAESVLAASSDCFSLAGHSMGGRVALEVMRLAPERVGRLALLDTGIDPIGTGEAGARERAQRMSLLRVAQEHGMRAMGHQWARGMVHPDRIDTPLFETILDMIERKTPLVFEAQIHALLERPDARDTFAALSVPTLLACGRQDAWSPLARHQSMHAMLPASRLAIIEHSGHMTMMEQPDAVSRALLDWLDN